ncbi:Cell-division control histidine kinase PdhS [Pseudovibrio axinellae]|uniref:histidine kinase n=1 Tax=Pseudovibrio axinellae TaxID=989403 RepID=A0A165U218_9HYPH|nr:PAS domain-containing sensor histidine kinase [Pseudovibrio axinellae]KZL09466.1 Cell-division control histidine kinase PdhS [Pseudovibrio axinellae]SEQ63982.1 PAS domain S-box-containing protein [Pseudovibrio axinellae]
MADFVFKRRQRPIRFTWELDRDGCFRSFSKEFAELLGPQDVALIGLPFDAVRKKLKMGKIPALSKAIKKQRAVTGATVLWPACNTDKVVPLDLSVQPAETETGDYDGLHGFGVIRSVDAKQSDEPVDPLAALAKLRAALQAEGAELESAPVEVVAEDQPPSELTREHNHSDRIVQDGLEPIEALNETEEAHVGEVLDSPLEDGITAPGFLQSEPELPELIIDFNEEDGEVDEENGVSETTDQERKDDADLAEETLAGVGEEPAEDIEAEAELAVETLSLPVTSDSVIEESEPELLQEEQLEESEGFLQLTDADVLHDVTDPLEVFRGVETVEQDTVALDTRSDQGEAVGVNAPSEAFAEEDLYAFETDLAEPEPFARTAPKPVSPVPTNPEPTSKDDFERAIANLPNAPKKKNKSGPRSLAELTSSIVRLVDKHPVSRESTGLSKPERDAFDKIARALGAEKTKEPVSVRTETQAQEPVSSTPEDTAALAVAQVDIAETDQVDIPDTAPAAGNIISLPADPVTRDENDVLEPKEGNVTHVVLPRVPPDIEEAAERAREKTGRIPDKPIVEPIDPRLLDRLPIGVAVVRDRDVVYANDTLLELLGYDRFEALNEAGGLEAIFAEPEECPTPSPQTVDRVVHVRLAEGGVLSVDARMHAVPWSGTQALMISVVDNGDRQPDTDASKAPVKTLQSDVPVVSDAQMKQLRTRVDELESMLATATDGVLVVDRRGIIRSANRSAVALFNAGEDDLLGAPFTDFLAEESHASALDYLDGLTANGVSSVLNDGREVICKTLDGDILPTFLSMGRVNRSDEKLFCAVLRDITQFKRAEEELVSARSKAEDANAHKSEYLAKISHEIRTPLNAVIGFSEVMQEERFGELGNMRYKEYVRDIHRSCSHMLMLVNDLLDLAKIEAGKVELTFEAVSAADIINECVALLQPQANEQRIIIRASTPLSVPKIVADPKTLRQITLNLLSNAIKFNRSGGQVIVSVVLDPNGEVHLRIRDTGHGMSKSDLEAALQPFRRLNASASTEGSGLGLPLTKALVEANRASFSINSEEDEGTLAEVTFPPQRVLAE